MKVWATTLAISALFLVPAISSQVNSPQSPAPSKIGTISIQAAIANTAEGKQASTELQAQFAPRSNELQNLQKQIQDLQSKVQSAQSVLSDEERARLQNQSERLSRSYQRKQQYFEDDLNAAQQEAVSAIGQKLFVIVAQYSKDHGYSVILDISGQQSPVVYSGPEVDVTQEITRIYNESHPAKASVTPPKSTAPPAPKPVPKP